VNAVVWEVLSCVLIDANISTLVMETARSPEILSSKLHGVMFQKPVILILTAVETSTKQLLLLLLLLLSNFSLLSNS